jgi:hypothetical protein
MLPIKYCGSIKLRPLGRVNIFHTFSSCWYARLLACPAYQQRRSLQLCSGVIGCFYICANKGENTTNGNSLKTRLKIFFLLTQYFFNFIKKKRSKISGNNFQKTCISIWNPVNYFTFFFYHFRSIECIITFI